MKYIIFILTFHYSASLFGQANTDSWTPLFHNIKEKNVQVLPQLCKELIINEGVDIRTLLSILHYNDISLTEPWISELFSTYNDDKISFFQTKVRFYKIDSLFTEAYILYHNYKLLKENTLKAYESLYLKKFNERISIRYQHSSADFGFYKYLYVWLGNPDKTEDEIICSFLQKRGIPLNKLLSYQELSFLFPNITDKSDDFDTVFQKSITHFRMKSIDAEKSKDINTALLYRDSILILNPFLKLPDAHKAKRLAMKNRLKDKYLHYLNYVSTQAMSPNYYEDTLPTFGRTKEDTAFVKFALNDLSAKTSSNHLSSVSYDLLLLSNRYAEQHDFAAGFTYPKQPLLENKNRKAKLFVSYVTPSFTEYPYSIKLLTRSPKDFLTEINFAFSYVTIHLLQYNFREHLIADSVFENFINTHAILVNMKVLDAESYYWLLDCYNTSVKHRESQYGWKMSEQEDETIIDNILTKRNREQAFLLPIGYLE